MKSLLVATLLALVSQCALAQVTVLDGDTIRMGGVTYRLWGIDAPESKQTCLDGWAAGVEATQALRALIGSQEVQCSSRGIDRFGRTIGLCRVDRTDLQAAMVRSGMAWAFTRYSSDYVDQEKAAIAGRLGVHAHSCQSPWEWRAQNRVR
jgi:endonuclease YncB( thermonuclease family)